MTRLVKIIISTAKFGILHVKYLVLPRMSTHVEMKLYVTEWYCSIEAMGH